MASEQITVSSKYSVKRLVMIAAKLAVTGVLIWYLLGEVDLAKSGEHLASFDIKWGLLAVFALAVLYVIATVRWQIYATALQIPLRTGTAFRLYLISQFLGQVLPAGLGNDAVRVWLLVQRGHAVGPSASSVVLERLTGMIGILVLIAVLLPLSFSYVDETAWRLIIIFVIVGGAGGISVILALSFLPRLITRWRHVALMSKLADIASEARHAGFMLKPATTVLILSLVMHLISVLAAYLIGIGLGLDLSPWACLALMPVVFLLATLPISLAGWGVREGATVATLSFAGVSDSGALALSILFGLAILVLSLLGAVFWLVQGRSAALKKVSEKQVSGEGTP